MVKVKTVKGFNPQSKVQWTSYLACGKIEGFEEVDASEIEAWAYLISTGQCWSLQGFYGRNASNLIEGSYISREGHINWDLLNEVY